MRDYARALTEGVVSNKQLVDELAEAIAEKTVVKLTTSTLGKADLGKDERRRRDLNSQALSSGSFLGFFPGCWVTRLPIRRPRPSRQWLAYFDFTMGTTGRRPDGRADNGFF